MPSFLYVSQAGQRDDDGFNVIFDYWWFGCGLLVSFFAAPALKPSKMVPFAHACLEYKVLCIKSLTVIIVRP